MSNYTLKLKPRDLLFLRDARPMEASDAGLGANWPRPDQLWNALINCFHRNWPERQQWEGAEHRKTDRERGSARHSSDRFGALQSIGPFPLDDKNGTLYLPCPLDLAMSENGTIVPMTLSDCARTNLPRPLSRSFSTPVLGKQHLPQWLSADDYRSYLEGKAIAPQKVPDLYTAERLIGIGIDADRGSVEDGKLYQAEYLRLHDHISLACQASCMIKPKGQSDELVDVFAQLGLPANLILGGQQGVMSIDHAKWQLPLNPSPATSPAKTLLRWTLLSPAVFPSLAASDSYPGGHSGGWLPTWINPENGAVQLLAPGEALARRPGEDRSAWRGRQQQQQRRIAATLVAARIGKPQLFSGWDLHAKNAAEGDDALGQGAKPTRAAVPAGSVYVFACDDHAALSALWQALDAQATPGRINRRSSLYGEKGFGIGVCSLIPSNQD